MTLQEFNERRVCYRKAVEINADHFEAYNNLGSALLQAERTDEAIVYYQKALKIKPNSINILNNLSDAFLQKGQQNDALPLLQKALALAKATSEKPLVQEIMTKLEKFYQANQSLFAK